MGTEASQHAAYIRYSDIPINLKLTTVFSSISYPTIHNPTHSHTLRVIKYNGICRQWISYVSITFRINVRTLPSLRRLDAGLSPRTAWYNRIQVHAGFVVDTLAVEKVSLRLLPCECSSVSGPYWFRYYRNCRTLVNSGVFE